MISIQAISKYTPKNFLDLKKRYKKINKIFLKNKIGASKVLRKNNNEDVIDMCIKSFKNFKKPINKNKIKMVILCTQNPEYNGLPHNSAIIHKRLNLKKNVACLDISQGCAGYLYGLKVAESFLKENEIALFFTCDPYSKIIVPNDYKTELLFGDAATMSILIKSKKVKLKNLIDSEFFTDGTYFDSIINKNGKLEMNGKNVMDFSQNQVPEFIKKFLKKNNLKVSQVDKFYFHQGSKHIVDTVAKSLDLKKNQLSNIIENIGNTVSSSIPLLLIKDNFLKKKKIIICGFGVGLSISAGLLF